MITNYLDEDYYIDYVDINKFKKIESLQLRKVNDLNIKLRVKRKQVQLTEEQELELVDMLIL